MSFFPSIDFATFFQQFTVDFFAVVEVVQESGVNFGMGKIGILTNLFVC